MMMMIRQLPLTSCLNAEVDLALRWMGDCVATELHIRADRKQESESKICEYPHQLGKGHF